MNELSKIDRNEITEYILTHNLSTKKAELETLTIGELVLMKVLLQMELEKNR